MFFDKLFSGSFGRKVFAGLAGAVLALALSVSSPTFASVTAKKNSDKQVHKVESPLNIAILIQDDLVSSVANEIGVTSDFIQSLPQGSRVMVGYITSGALQVRQPFTTDLNSAAHSLRVP